MTNRELHSFHMSHAVQDAIVRDMRRKGNVVYIVHLKFVSIAGVQLTLLYAVWNSQYWFIFLGVTADIDCSTNLSADQASYTLMISQQGQLHQSPKETVLETLLAFHQQTLVY